MLLFGSVTIWVAFLALIGSAGLYLVASSVRQKGAGNWQAWVMRGRIAFIIAAAGIVAASADLGTLLVTHRFDAKYVYEHSARAMDPLYWFPSFWSGQEGSFLLWAFWTGILGVIVACTSGNAERRVMPVYNGVLLFLVGIMLIRSPFLPLDTHGGPIPAEGLGLNPNLENPWMVIHPPTLFLGFAALTAPFAFALSALFWRDWDGWLKRTTPWALFGFSILGLAMMMGGYWAYEMLGWGGFWGWDPVENGPFIPWLGLVAFLHLAQIQRVRGGVMRSTLVFSLLPFLLALYETFLTRTGILEKFSVHSFSTLGGIANTLLLGALVVATVLSLSVLIWRSRTLEKGQSALETPTSREFAYAMAVIALTVCALIAAIGMSAPLLTTLASKIWPAIHVASVKEDFYNTATFPIAVLLSIGMGIGPYLAWRGQSAVNTTRLVTCYAISVIAAIGYILAARFIGTALNGMRLVPQLILFTSSFFALISNAILLRRIFPSKARPKADPIRTAGSIFSHLGAAVLLLGIVCLVTFVQRDPDVVLVQGAPRPVLDSRYTMTYTGQTGDYKTDRNNALKFDVVSADRKEHFTAYMPFALRAVEGGDKKLFGHPAITHHIGGDLYLALKDGPDLFYKTPIFKTKVGLGDSKKVGPYQIQFVRFDRDPTAAAFVQATGQMPDKFPVSAVVNVTYEGKTTQVNPQFIMRKDDPTNPEAPEVKIPGGWLIAFENMNAGSADKDNPNAGASQEQGAFALRADSGPPTEAFEIEVTTRPMINLVWIGTMMIVLGGLLTMRRRILENRASDIPDLPLQGGPSNSSKSRSRAKGRAQREERVAVPMATTGRSVGKQK